MSELVLPSFSGSKALVTGHTGFKGAWLSAMLRSLGATVFGLSNTVPRNKRHIFFELGGHAELENEDWCVDVRDFDGLEAAIRDYSPDFVFHLAAQPLVYRSLENPMETFSTNVMGSVNILEIVRSLTSPPTTVIVTSDKCYQNDGRTGSYKESDPLGGKDPYSASKAMAEVAFGAFSNSYHGEFVNGLASARAGNVFGGGDWSERRLIPDVISQVSRTEKVVLRMPEATRPWTFVLDVLWGYLVLAAKLRSRHVSSGTSWNFASGENLSVLDVTELLLQSLGKGRIEISEDDLAKSESKLLQIDANQSKKLLNWRPPMPVSDRLTETARWYGAQERGEEMRLHSLDVVKAYFESVTS